MPVAMEQDLVEATPFHNRVASEHCLLTGEWRCSSGSGEYQREFENCGIFRRESVMLRAMERSNPAASGRDNGTQVKINTSGARLSFSPHMVVCALLRGEFAPTFLVACVTQVESFFFLFDRSIDSQHKCCSEFIKTPVMSPNGDFFFFYVQVL